MIPVVAGLFGLVPCGKAFLERRCSPSPLASIGGVAVFWASKLRGRDFSLGQHTGGLLPHLAQAVLELQGAHIAPLVRCRGPAWAPFRVGSL